MRKVNKMIGDILKWVLRTHKIYTTDPFSHISYSQVGEDIVLKKLFQDKETGFYVDVGAFHPKRYSNTYLLYLKGWMGINIDAMPHSMELFNAMRPRDINLEISIGLKKEKGIYHIFEEQAFNGFESQQVSSKLVKKQLMTIVPLHEVLDTYLPKNQQIDVLCIDVEGMDYTILLSHGWKQYVPSVVVIEDMNFSMQHPQKSKIYSFLMKKNYILYAYTPPSLIFVLIKG